MSFCDRPFLARVERPSDSGLMQSIPQSSQFLQESGGLAPHLPFLVRHYDKISAARIATQLRRYVLADKMSSRDETLLSSQGAR